MKVAKCLVFKSLGDCGVVIFCKWKCNSATSSNCGDILKFLILRLMETFSAAGGIMTIG